MKRFLQFAGVLAVMLVAGCQSAPCDDYCGGTVLDTKPEPKPAPVVYGQPREEPAMVSCAEAPTSGCGTYIRTVREPVEVVYRRTVYKTVYEPKTYKSVNYEREAYAAPRTAPVVYTAPKKEKVVYRTVVRKAPEVAFEECDTLNCYK